MLRWISRRIPPCSTATLIAALSLLAAAPLAADRERALTFTDLMKMRGIEDPVIADNGAWVAYSLVPDRGDGELVVRATEGQAEHRTERGHAPAITTDGAWVAARLEPTLAEKERARDKKKGTGKDDGPEPGLVLLATSDGAVRTFERVERFAFSADGRVLARHHAKAEEADESAPQDEPNTPGESKVPGEPPTPGERPAPTGEAPEAHAETPPPEGVIAAETPTKPSPETAGEEPSSSEDDEDDEIGTQLVLRHLATGTERTVEHVSSWAFDDVGTFLAYAVRAPGGQGNGVFVVPLGDLAAAPITVVATAGDRYQSLAWTEEPRSDLAFTAERPPNAEDRREEEAPAPRAPDREASDMMAEETAGDERQPPTAELWLWHGTAGDTSERGGEVVTASDDAPQGWYLPADNELTWSDDGQRLFFGYRPRNAWRAPDDEQDEASDSGGDEDLPPFDPYDTAAILDDTTLDLWHSDDPLIMTNQRERYEEESKHLYLAVYHRPAAGTGDAPRGRVVPLASIEVRDVEPSNNPRAVLAHTDIPYRKERTWAGSFDDIYWISLADGVRQRVAERRPGSASLSPDGRFVVYFDAPHWMLWDSADATTRSLTADLEVPFANEDHDYPRTPPGYGVADWLEDGSAVLIYDKYDIWSFPTADLADTAPHRITGGEGRAQQVIYRLVDLDPERDFVHADEALLLTAYHDRLKHRGLARATPDGEKAETLIAGDDETVTVLAKADDTDRLLLTRESYRTYPDLWTATGDLDDPRRLSDANPEIASFAWGHAELVEWLDLDGRPLQGVLIKPEHWQPGERLPVLVYFYRFFSQRLHRFNEPVVNHRPSFPLYAGDGYAVFLPDIRVEIGRPGLSAVKAIVPGVQKLIDMGVADPDAIGLHGHSWSGYQTAFAVTQTNLFKAAVAGAPVSNMTSAYSGIRWGSGLARQFQYEMGQSRLGKSLWEARDRYIDNSPVFFADRIETPMLIMFGDQDDAVPWYQGIELYLALRRLDKDAWFLQYRGEPHHLKQYANKLDYATKMKEFFDHYLQGEPAPVWLTEGVAYQGD